MSDTNLMLHCGAKAITRDDLNRIECPKPTATWFPLKHADVLHSVLSTLEGSGFGIDRQRLAVARDNHRFFGTLDLKSELAPGVSLAVGIRNSTDMSFPLGFCAGSRVFVCDNLAFRSELLVKRKHTKHGADRFREAIAEAVQTLPQFIAGEARRIELMRSSPVSDTEAESLLLRSYEKRIVSHLVLPHVIRAWRQPDAEEFQPRTTWSLFNAFTGALKPRSQTSPQEFAVQTMRLYQLLSPGPMEN